MSESVKEVELTQREVDAMCHLLYREEEELAHLRNKLEDLDFEITI